MKTVPRSPFLLHFEVVLKLFSLFKIPYLSFVNLELLFARELHISPVDLWEMPFYDILYLYRQWQDYVEAMNEKSDDEKQTTMEAVQNMQPQMPEMPKPPDMGEITRGMFNGSSLPNFGI